MKTIRFAAINDHIETPLPARNYVPDWYKKMERFFGSGNKPKFVNGGVNKTVKLCVPLLDSLTAGYMVTSWQDILVEQHDGNPVLLWSGDVDIARVRPNNGSSSLPVPAGHNSTDFTWYNPICIKTPKGYSALITHPFNRYDLPFTTTSGVVDADATMNDGSVPFFLKEGFEGIIPKGTPLFQVIPFKRDNWQHEVDSSILAEAAKNKHNANSVLSGWYKSNVWKRKTFN